MGLALYVPVNYSKGGIKSFETLATNIEALLHRKAINNITDLPFVFLKNQLYKNIIIHAYQILDQKDL